MNMRTTIFAGVTTLLDIASVEPSDENARFLSGALQNLGIALLLEVYVPGVT